MYSLSLLCRWCFFLWDLGHDDPELHLPLALANLHCDQCQHSKCPYIHEVPSLALPSLWSSPELVSDSPWSCDSLSYPPPDAIFRLIHWSPSWRFHHFCRHASQCYESLKCQPVLRGCSPHAFIPILLQPTSPLPTKAPPDVLLGFFLHSFNPAKMGLCLLILECFDDHWFYHV